jgi:MFS family permease
MSAAAVTTAAPPQTQRRSTLPFVACALMVLMIAGGAPSPLYGRYQQEIGFSSSTLTMIFAIYAIALLLSLMIVGSLSDYVGRKPVLVGALLVEASAMAIFLPAHSVGTLLLARTVQGIATGAATAAFSASLIDTQRPGSRTAAIINSSFPSLGLGIGALLSGAALRFAGNPADTVFAILAVAFVLLALLVAVLPETGPRRPGALYSLRPSISVPEQVRGPLLIVTPTLVAIWSVGGLFLSLGPSLAVAIFGLHGPFAGALVIATLTFAASIITVVLRSKPPALVMLVGTGALIAGPAVLLVAIAATSTPIFFVGVAITGVGFGGAFYGVMRTIGELVGPAERAGVFAVVFVINYLAFSLPAVAAGIAAQHFGLRDTVVVYAIAVIVMALGTLGALALRRRSSAPIVAP